MRLPIKNSIHFVKRYSTYLTIGALFLLLTNVPYISLGLRTPDDHHYTGIGLEAVADKLVYYSSALQGARGMLWMNNMHTGEPQVPHIFSPVWFGVGLTTHIFGGSVPLAYHAWRIVLTVLYLCLVVYILRQLFSHERDRLMALMLILFGSGLGWFYSQIHPEIMVPGVHWLRDFQLTPVELYVTEMYSFLAFVQSPLFMVSHIALLGCFALGIRAVESPGIGRISVFIASVGATALIHPYDALIISVIFLSWCVWKFSLNRDVRLLGIAAMTSLMLSLAVGCTVFLFSNQPALAGWLSQNVTLSPRLAMYLWSLGLVGVLWLFGLVTLFNKKSLSNWQALMVIWSCLGWMLIYLPVATNRRLTNAWFFPVALIASYAIQFIFKRARSFALRAALAWIIIIGTASGTLWRTIVYATYVPPLEEKYAIYLDSHIYGALNAVRTVIPPESVVLSNEPFIGMLAAAYAPIKLFLGHEHQTVGYSRKAQQVTWFFSDHEARSVDESRISFLRSNAISHVILYRPSMRGDFSWIDAAPYFEKVFSSDIITVYRVRVGL